jgi:cysteine-rich repeat protein
MRLLAPFTALFCVARAMLGCAADFGLDVPDPSESALPSTGDVMDRVVECDEAPHGTRCGAPGSDWHCIYDACVENACGDDVRAGLEACDDGNEINGDGCNERCELETAADDAGAS